MTLNYLARFILQSTILYTTTGGHCSLMHEEKNPCPLAGPVVPSVSLFILSDSAQCALQSHHAHAWKPLRCSLQTAPNVLSTSMVHEDILHL